MPAAACVFFESLFPPRSLCRLDAVDAFSLLPQPRRCALSRVVAHSHPNIDAAKKTVVAGLGARRRRAARLRRPPAAPAREGPEPAALRRVPAPTVGRRLVDRESLPRRAARPRRRHQGGVAVRAHELAVEGHGRESLVPHQLERAERERREVAPEAEGVRRRAGPARRRLAERLLEAAPGVARGEGRLARLGCPCNWWRQEGRVAERRVVGAGEAERVFPVFLFPFLCRGGRTSGADDLSDRPPFGPCRFFVLGLCAGADGDAERDERAEPRHRCGLTW